MSKLLLQGGLVASDSGVARLDLLISDGKVIARAPHISIEGEEVEIVDVTHRIVIPGGVDVHTHLDSRLNGANTADDFESGTKAAAAGGTTTIIDFAPQGGGQSLVESHEAHLGRAEGRAVIDYGLHQCVTDLEAGSLDELPELVARGVTSFKAFMAYRGTAMLEDPELKALFRASTALGAQVCLHAEDGDEIDQNAAELVSAGMTGAKGHHLSRPPHTEVNAVERALGMIKETGASVYFVHISTEAAATAVARAREEGLRVVAETCTHYLVLDESLYDQPDEIANGYIIAPPLRTDSEQAALWEGLKRGDLTVVSSDHCPYCLSEKNSPNHADFRQIPNGAPGIEHRMQLLYSEGVSRDRITLPEYVQLASTAPAKQFGLYPAKGALEVGSDADLVILNPQGETVVRQETQLQRVDYTPYDGWKLHGELERVYSRGELVISEGKYVGAEGRGRFLVRSVRSLDAAESSHNASRENE